MAGGAHCTRSKGDRALRASGRGVVENQPAGKSVLGKRANRGGVGAATAAERACKKHAKPEQGAVAEPEMTAELLVVEARVESVLQQHQQAPVNNDAQEIEALRQRVALLEEQVKSVTSAKELDASVFDGAIDALKDELASCNAKHAVEIAAMKTKFCDELKKSSEQYEELIKRDYDAAREATSKLEESLRDANAMCATHKFDLDTAKNENNRLEQLLEESLRNAKNENNRLEQLLEESLRNAKSDLDAANAANAEINEALERAKHDAAIAGLDANTAQLDRDAEEAAKAQLRAANAELKDAIERAKNDFNAAFQKQKDEFTAAMTAKDDALKIISDALKRNEASSNDAAKALREQTERNAASLKEVADEVKKLEKERDGIEKAVTQLRDWTNANEISVQMKFNKIREMKTEKAKLVEAERKLREETLNLECARATLETSRQECAVEKAALEEKRKEMEKQAKITNEALDNFKKDMAWNDVCETEYQKAVEENKKLKSDNGKLKAKNGRLSGRVVNLRGTVQEFSKNVGGTPATAEYIRDMIDKLSMASIGHKVAIKIEAVE